MERESTLARKRVQDAEIAMMQEQEHMGNVQKGRWTNAKPETTFDVMLNAIGDNLLSNRPSSDDEEAGEKKDDDKEEAAHGQLSEHAEPGWELGPISKQIQHCM
jgi:hypothetical protein